VKEHEETFASVPEYIHHAVLEAHLRTAVSRTLDQSVLDGLTAPWLGEEGQRAYYRQVGQYDYAYTQELETLYPTVTVPTIVFWGEEDRWVDISEGKRFVQLLPDAPLQTLPDAGHFVMLDAPGLFARYLDEWLGAL
jgi:pimeloyl-ACP methyl ester carboxylesterase